MDEKIIYKLLNDVETNVDEFTDISQFEKERIKMNLKKTKTNKFKKPVKSARFKKSLMVASLALLIGLSSQSKLTKKVYAAAQSKLDQVTYSLNWALATNKEVDTYSNIINKTVEDKGIKLKLTDAIIDKDQIIISSLVEGDKALSNIDFDYNIYINGKKVQPLATSGHSGIFQNQENVFYNLSILSIKDMDYKDDMDISIVVNSMKIIEDSPNGPRDKFIRGKWAYDFRANPNKLAEATNNIKVDYSFNIDGVEVLLDIISLNPVNQRIRASILDGGSLGYDLMLKGYDDQNNPVEFNLATVLDNKLNFRYENIDRDLADNIKSLKLRPYASRLPEANGRLLDQWEPVGEEFIIEVK